MCLLLLSRPRVHGRALQSIRTAQFQRSSVHYWQYLRQKAAWGATKILKYEALKVPDPKSQSIRLWQGQDYLGRINLQEVIENHLGPGYMLWLRNEPPSKKTQPAPPGDYDYEVRSLKTERPETQTLKLKATKGLRAKEYYMSASSAPASLRHHLREAYRFLFLDPLRHGTPSEKSPLERVKVPIPVEFHLKAPGPLPAADLSLFTKDRMDLHPAVITRALPEGVFLLLEPRGDIESGDALWLVATDGLKAAPFPMPSAPAAKAAQARRMVQIRRDEVTELLESGKIQENGQPAGMLLQEKLRAKRKREKEEKKQKREREREEKKRKREQRESDDSSDIRTESSSGSVMPDWMRGLLGTMDIQNRGTSVDQESPGSEGVDKGVEQLNQQHTGGETPEAGSSKGRDD